MTRYLDLIGPLSEYQKASVRSVPGELVTLPALSEHGLEEPASPELDPVILRAVELLEGRIVDVRPADVPPYRRWPAIRRQAVRGRPRRYVERFSGREGIRW